MRSWSGELRALGIAAVLSFGAAPLALAGFASAAGRPAVTCPSVSPANGAVSPAPAPGADWAGCDLAGADLLNANLAGANLSGADLSGRTTYLGNANLTSADLAGANLSDAQAGHANLADVTLTGANLTGTTLKLRGVGRNLRCARRAAGALGTGQRVPGRAERRPHLSRPRWPGSIGP
jgi:uncharacterized protein YjbI with pentapeptide repeats